LDGEICPDPPIGDEERAAREVRQGDRDEQATGECGDSQHTDSLPDAQMGSQSWHGHGCRAFGRVDPIHGIRGLSPVA